MKISSIDETNNVYACSKNASINWHSIKFSELQTFTRVIQELVNNIGELDNDDEWFGLLKRVRGVRFDMIAAPLPENLLEEKLTELIHYLDVNKNRLAHSHPNASDQYTHLIKSSEHLVNIKKSQLLSTLSDKLAQYNNRGKTVVLVCDARLLSDSEKGVLSMGFKDVEVASSSYLRGDVCFENIVVIGPTRWHQPYVFSAPRAENILVLKYAWIRDNWKHQQVFIEPLKQKISKLMQSVIDEPFDSSAIEPSSLLPPAFDFQHLQRQMIEASKGHNEVDYVQAKLFLLEEGWVVPLGADDTSSVLVIDLGDLVSPIRKIKVNEIEPGIFVLLRTTGGGDFIVPVADQIMGQDGVRARQYQSKWKSLLRTKVVENGYDKVFEDLLKYGSTRANYVNVRNWMSDRSIKTEYKNDFDAILRLLSLEDEKDTYWELMEQIDRAHRKAGYIIAKMLLDKVKNSDLRNLKRTGKMDFELASENGISITAFQVKDISPDRIQVLPWQIGNPIKQGD
jgi:hypothetical protein